MTSIRPIPIPRPHRARLAFNASRLAVAGFAIAGLALARLMAQSAPPFALLNLTPSIPRGLYVHSFDQRIRPGVVVAIDPPREGRRYLTGLGMPATTPLLKHVAALGGDVACRAPDRMQWPGGRVVAQAWDRRGVILPTWSGCRRLAGNQLLVVGDTPASFDSRYFGPITTTAVEGVYREVVTW